MLPARFIPGAPRGVRVGLLERSITSFRPFSSSQWHRNESDQPTDGRAATEGGSGVPSLSPKNRDIPPANLKPKNMNFQRPRPRRIIDARSFAAPQSGGLPAQILKNPKLRTARAGRRTHQQNPKFAKKPAALKERKSGHRRPRNQALEEGEDGQEADLEKVYHELAVKSNPASSRYSPQASDFSTLKETWPSLPISVESRTAAVTEQLLWLSERYPNGYIPPHQLGERLFDGQYVHFLSEEEKVEALEVANRLSHQKADQESQREGDLLEPETINFGPIRTENQKTLIQSLAQGKYPDLYAEQAHKSPVLLQIQKNLQNNKTYQEAGKSSQFLTKVESLLSSTRSAKRA